MPTVRATAADLAAWKAKGLIPAPVPGREGRTRPLSEKEFQSAVVSLAKANSWLCYHTFDSRRSARGYPDLTLVRPGRLVFAELKTDTGRFTIDQRVWLAALASAGAEVHMWRPGDWKRIEAVLVGRV